MKGQAQNFVHHYFLLNILLLAIQNAILQKVQKDPFDCPHIPKLCYASLKSPVLMPARLYL